MLNLFNCIQSSSKIFQNAIFIENCIQFCGWLIIGLQLKIYQFYVLLCQNKCPRWKVNFKEKILNNYQIWLPMLKLCWIRVWRWINIVNWLALDVRFSMLNQRWTNVTTNNYVDPTSVCLLGALHRLGPFSLSLADFLFILN